MNHILFSILAATAITSLSTAVECTNFPTAEKGGCDARKVTGDRLQVTEKR